MSDVETITVEILKEIRDDLSALRSEQRTMEATLREHGEQLAGIRAVLGDHAVALSVLRSGQDRILTSLVAIVEDHERRLSALENRS
jgi:hypothetical protein